MYLPADLSNYIKSAVEKSYSKLVVVTTARPTFAERQYKKGWIMECLTLDAGGSVVASNVLHLKRKGNC